MYQSTEPRRADSAGYNKAGGHSDCVGVGSRACMNRPTPRPCPCPSSRKGTYEADERHQMQARARASQLATGPDQSHFPPSVPIQADVLSEQHDLSDASSGSKTDEAIPNPPIPGNPAPSVDSLLIQVNHFAKTYGFGVVKANGMVRPGHRSRYIFQCDRYGTPRPGRGAGLRKRKS